MQRRATGWSSAVTGRVSRTGTARSSNSATRTVALLDVVRWGDTGHEDLFFPGPDASVVPPRR